MTLQEMQNMLETSEDQELQSGTKSAYFTVNCWLQWVFTNENSPDRQMFYMACKVCKKKVYNEADSFRCERCDKNHSEAVPTYNFTVRVTDHTDSI